MNATPTRFAEHFGSTQPKRNSERARMSQCTVSHRKGRPLCVRGRNAKIAQFRFRCSPRSKVPKSSTVSARSEIIRAFPLYGRKSALVSAPHQIAHACHSLPRCIKCVTNDDRTAANDSASLISTSSDQPIQQSQCANLVCNNDNPNQHWAFALIWYSACSVQCSCCRERAHSGHCYFALHQCAKPLQHIATCNQVQHVAHVHLATWACHKTR